MKPLRAVPKSNGQTNNFGTIIVRLFIVFLLFPFIEKGGAKKCYLFLVLARLLLYIEVSNQFKLNHYEKLLEMEFVRI